MAENTFHRLKRDYLLAYLDTMWQSNPDTGLRVWVEAFQDALDPWQEDECRRLLHEIKKAPQTSEIEALVHCAEGQLAEQDGDFNLAIQHYQVSLVLNRAAENLLRQGYVLNDLGLVYAAQGQLAEAVDYLQDALKVFRAADKTDMATEVMSHLAGVYTAQEEWTKAEICLEAVASHINTHEMQALLFANKGTWYQAQRQFGPAYQCFMKALNIYQELGDTSNHAYILNNLGLLAFEQRRLEEARGHLTEALSLTQSLSDWPGTVRTLGNLALVTEAEGNLEGAVQYCTEAIESADALGDTRAAGTFLNMRGYLRIDLLDLKAAVTDLKRSLDLARQTHNQAMEMTTLNNLGTAYRHLGHLKKAHTCYQKALAFAERLNNQRSIGEVIGNLGHLHAAQNDNRLAQTYYERAMSIAKQVEDPVLECASLIGLCTLAFEQQDFENLAELADQAWELAAATSQPDVLTRLSWIRGDLAMFSNDLDTCFLNYAQAGLFAAQAGGTLLEATLQRIEIHLGYLQSPEIKRTCELLIAEWNKSSLIESHPRLDQWLKETLSKHNV